MGSLTVFSAISFASLEAVDAALSYSRDQNFGAICGGVQSPLGSAYGKITDEKSDQSVQVSFRLRGKDRLDTAELLLAERQRLAFKKGDGK